MARQLSRLSQMSIKNAKQGMHADGGGLYLHVSAGGARSWIYRYRLYGRSREMGLGGFPTTSLAEARDRALECRRLRRDGIDPIGARRADRDAKKTERSKAITFAECAEQYIASHRAGWRNPKHAAQWRSTLAAHAFPVFGDLPVGAVDVNLVMRVIDPLWRTRTETASRLRGRIECILDWARTRSYREGENPARWRGHLENLLPRKSKLVQTQHYAALPFPELPAFMERLRVEPSTVARALEFAILTAGRTGEVLGARWREIDLAERVWILPAERMKGGRQHRVPLSDAAMAVLDKLPLDREFLFAGRQADRPLSKNVMLRRVQREGLTTHGFRSTFRDWAAERTTFQREVCEMALAHAIPDQVEAAYRRGDLFDKRRLLMEAWGKFCSTPATPAGVVVPLRAHA